MDNLNKKKKKFISKFSDEATFISVSPGRVNLIGEHTDYNGGWVLPAAIDKCSTVLLKSNDMEKIRVYAFDIDAYFEYMVNMPFLHKGWQSYVYGVIQEINKRKSLPSGFDILISGDVPFGAGLSSSASIECALAFGLNECFELGFSKVDLVMISQAAEHNYVGVKCGIMDQYASVMGKRDFAICLDCKEIKHEYVPLELGEYVLLLCNTNVSHSLADSEYNSRREQCEKGVAILKKHFPRIAYLRDIKERELISYKNEFQTDTFDKCLYVVQENERVLEAVHALKQENLAKLGELMYASHHGLSTLYMVSCPELDFLVEQTKEKDYILGSRMMGGGFGGCTINIIHKDKVDEFIQEVSPKYLKRFKKEMTPYIANIGDGARLIQ